MGASKERDLEAGLPDPGTPASQTPKCQSPQTADAEGELSLRVFLPVITQKEHFVAALSESLSVGLGLGSAVGVWAVINAAIPNTHVANWVGGLIIGLFLAPFFDKAARLVFAKLFTVLKKPRFSNWTRIIDHVIVVTSALVTIGSMKGIQRQYGPFHTSLGFEYLVFMLGFTAYSFMRTVLFTVALNHNYERESVTCGWRQLAVELFWEYMDHFHHVFVLITENLRDILTFATYPYLAALWLGHWDVIDPQGKLAWVAHGLNIGFFFTEFVIIKELTYLVATPFWSPDLPHHHHHSL